MTACKHCGKPIGRYDETGRQWVHEPQFPGQRFARWCRTPRLAGSCQAEPDEDGAGDE